MGTARKITVEVPPELLAKAQRTSGTGIGQTARAGLQLLAASRTCARLRRQRGKVLFSRRLAGLIADRRSRPIPRRLQRVRMAPLYKRTNLTWAG